MSAVLRGAPIVARGERLVLREFTWADAADIVSLHRHERLRQWLLDDFPLDQASVAQVFLQRLAALYRQCEGLGIWHASLVGTGEFVGWFSLMPQADQPDRVELGARLAPQAWGQGLSLEGGSLLLDHAFDALQLHEVWAYCHPQQRSARAALLTFGYHTSGTSAYNGALALAHVIARDAWHEARRRPLRARLRAALAQLRQDSPEGQVQE